MANNFYAGIYLTQKEFCNKMGMGDARFTIYDMYLESIKKMILLQMDISENMIRSYVGLDSRYWIFMIKW
jgi:hypothetical protein